MTTTTDQTAALYGAAAGTINQGSHAARDGFEPTPVNHAQLVARVDALDDVAGALLAAVAILRDAPGAGATDQLQAATTAAWSLGSELRSARRLIAGARPDQQEP